MNNLQKKIIKNSPEYFKDLNKRKQEYLKYINQFIKRDKKIDYMIFLGSTRPKETRVKIEYFLKEKNISKKDIWVRESPDFPGYFQVGVNSKKLEEDPYAKGDFEAQEQREMNI